MLLSLLLFSTSDIRYTCSLAIHDDTEESSRTQREISDTTNDRYIVAFDRPIQYFDIIATARCCCRILNLSAHVIITEKHCIQTKAEFTKVSKANNNALLQSPFVGSLIAIVKLPKMLSRIQECAGRQDDNDNDAAIPKLFRQGKGSNIHRYTIRL
jgi:hypothetical protein